MVELHVNITVCPRDIEAVLAAIVTWGGGGVTAKVVVPLTAPEVAVMVVLPAPAPVASPPLLIVATFVAEEFHVAEFVRFCVLPSLNVPVAASCTLAPTTSD